MTSYREMAMQDLRLVVLRMLASAPSYAANVYIIGRELERNGHHESKDSIQTQLAWLAEQGLVHLVTDPPLVVATLSDRGLDVAQGRSIAPGVQRPRPE